MHLIGRLKISRGLRETACCLLARFGVSKALYEEFLRPLLLVGLFAPPEELSAAAVLGTFYFYSESFPYLDPY